MPVTEPRTAGYKERELPSVLSARRPEPVCLPPTATVPLERNFQPFVQLPEQQQTALRGVLQAVLFDEELLQVLEQVVRPAASRCSGDVGRLDLLGRALT